MSRGKSVRLLATLPATYCAGFEKRLDKRTRVYRAWKAKVEKIIADQGGPEGMSHLELFAAHKVGFDELIIECGWFEFFTIGKVDYGLNSQAGFSHDGTVNKALGGPKRKARTVHSLRDLMNGKAAAKSEAA